MFGWFRGKACCPVEPDRRAWLVGRTRWLIGEFGLEAARQAEVILPSEQFFPEAYDASPEAGRVLFDRVSHYLRIDPTGIDLLFWEEHAPTVDERDLSGGAAGLYEGSTLGTRISLEASALADPLLLVATAAHELAHVLLLGQGRLTDEEPDHEELTDLLTIYLGFGVFTANSRVRDRSMRHGHVESWSIRRLGYLDQASVGFALALWGRLREERSPVWANHLCADVRAVFNQASRWLAENGDALLDPSTGAPVSLSDDELPPGFGKGR